MNETKLDDAKTVETNKKVIVLIVIVGIVVAFFIAASAFIAITQSVSKSHFETILQSIGQFVFVTDENLIIKNVNEKVLKTLNVKIDELLNAQFQQLVTFENQKITIFLENVKNEIECIFTFKDILKIPVLMTISEIRTNESSLTGFVISMQDLRELKTIQARLNLSLIHI